jgi:hypothetical protein
MATEREPAVTDAEDQDFFASLLDDKGEEAESKDQGTETPPSEDSAEARARDEKGRFAPRPEGGQPPEQPAEQELSPGEMIPPWRLREEAEKRREEADRRARFEQENVLLRQRLAELERQFQPVEEIPDILVEPERFAQTIEQRLTEQFERRFVNSSMGRAHRAHGEQFEAAYRDLATYGDPVAKHRVLQSDDPGEALLEWHRRETTLAAIGSDPRAFRDRLADELLSDPDFRKRAIENWRAEAAGGGQRSKSASRLPSLNRATSAKRDDVDTLSDDEEFFRSSLRLQR